jgi:hypothetical protein
MLKPGPVLHANKNERIYPPNIYIPYFHCPLKSSLWNYFFQAAPLVGILVISTPWIAADVEVKTRSQSTVQVSCVGRAKWQAHS